MKAVIVRVIFSKEEYARFRKLWSHSDIKQIIEDEGVGQLIAMAENKEEDLLINSLRKTKGEK